MFPFVLFALALVFSVVAMDEDLYGNGRRFLTSSDTYVVKVVDVMAVSQVVPTNDSYDFDKPTLFHQLERQKMQATAALGAPAQRTIVDQTMRIFGCEIPPHHGVSNSVVECKPQPSVSIARTVSHPLVSSGGIMPE